MPVELTPETDYELAVQAHLPHGLSSLTTAASTTFDELDMWREEHFGSREATGIGANDGNPDGDAYPNLFEFTFVARS